MNKDIINILICPDCRNETLHLEAFDEKGGEVWNGRLVCSGCSRWFRIENAIVDLLPANLRRMDLYQSFAERFRLPFAAPASDAQDSQKIGQIEFFKQDLADYDRDVAESSLYKALDNVYYHAWIERNLRPDDFMVSIGCGEGRQCLSAASRRIRTIGIDICEEMLRLGKEKSDHNQLGPMIDFIAADGEDIPLKNNSFKGCAIVGTLHHVPDPGKLLKNAAAKLTPGGHVFSMDPHDSPVRFIFDFMMKIWKLYDEEASEAPLMSEEKIGSWFRNAGLDGRTILSTYLPPHLLYMLSTGADEWVLKISDGVFNHVPLLRKCGGVIFAEGMKKPDAR